MATMEELADKVAHATTGKEVRGAIAEGLGQFDQVKGEVFRRLEKIEKTLYGTVYINGSPNDEEGSNQSDGVVINQTPDDNLTQFIKLN